MASKEQTRATSPSTFYHALLRPTVLQILRAQGYYSCSPTVLDTITELAGRYLTKLSQSTVFFAEQNNENPNEPTLVDVRMALESCGVFGPAADSVAEEWRREEDTKAIESFIRWAKGKKNAKIRKTANALQQTGSLEAVDEPMTDYLAALKKKHNKTDQDSKYAGTVLGKGLDYGEIMVEGGEAASIQEWAKMMRERQQRPPEPDSDSRPPSSGLSSLTDGEIDMMDMS
ncbi:uncharacterized protein BCR38DRAFT_167046 [Pseudomassariella vexata]|uniref:Bromodomain associated domain-containing protein n=1 Tax=Pseudomassariella vexata TaxID=1141098 RepID=A0A1Y2E2Q2_9PEZI|nr:uncharacterized protein BCR38DRAFT_167046 [Pseudomassariella vexata]ORY65831.1 hypothetical protein BCR38DRAFT_167046 [Pseudomassariella vexata]